MAKNIEEYFVEKVTEYLDEQDILRRVMFKLLKHYHNKYMLGHVHIGDCRVCGSPSIYDYSTQEGFTNCLPCMDCSALYCNTCLDKSYPFVVLHSYSYESKKPSVRCLINDGHEECVLCDTETEDGSFTEDLCPDCYQERL